MPKLLLRALTGLGLSLGLGIGLLTMLVTPALAQSGHEGHNHGPAVMPQLPPEQAAAAAGDYKQYCALCHGEDRAGNANDHAPSLKSKSLFASGSPGILLTTIYYGRPGTAMGGYLDEIGGPLSIQEAQRLFLWLFHQSGAEIEPLNAAPVEGDVSLGEEIYQSQCTECHGTREEEKIGPLITNPATLALLPDTFLRYAIENGRDGTKMEPFKDKLSAAEIDAVTAYLRSKAIKVEDGKVQLQSPPAPEDYAINPYGPAPQFNLENGVHIRAADLDKSIKAGERMILLDTRVMSQWQTAHIKGSVPLPYYSNLNILQYLPQDTWIVAYCECPRAAAESVVQQLRARGYTKTAVLYEGIYGWLSLGYPVEQGSILK